MAKNSFGKDEQQDWELTTRLKTAVAYKRFIAAYPESSYLIEAQAIYTELKEEKDWQTASKRNKVFAYEKYLEAYPSGKYANEAGMRLELLEHDLVWRETKEEDSIKGYMAYRQTYPKGNYFHEAEARITELVKQQQLTVPTSEGKAEEVNSEEEQALEEASVEDTVTAYNSFLKSFPNGHYAGQVKKRIRQLEAKLTKQYRVIEEELQAWEYADKQHSRLAYRDFLRKFPTGRFSDLAEQRIQQLENKMVIKVRTNTGKPLSSPKLMNKPDPEAQKLEMDRSERDLMGYRLAWMWVVGFVILSLLTFFLARFLYPIGLISAFLVGGFFVFHRGKRITKRENFVYTIGAGIATFFLVKELLGIFINEFWILIPVSGLAGILIILFLRSYFKGLDD